MIVKIDYKFTSLNDYIDAERTNKYIASNIKKEETEVAKLHFLGKKIRKRVHITFVWHLPNKRKDPDNVAFGKKFILDGMVKAGCLENDNLKWIASLKDEFEVDGNDFVEVLIESERDYMKLKVNCVERDNEYFYEIAPNVGTKGGEELDG